MPGILMHHFGVHNKLLASLPSADYARIAPKLTRVPMTRVGQRVYRDREFMHLVYFPEGGAYSLMKVLADGHTAEVCAIGAEGAIGIEMYFGQRQAECDVVVQMAGLSAHAMSSDLFLAEMDRRGVFHSQVARFHRAFVSQIIQRSVCNGVHSALQRCAQWLLSAHDHSPNGEFPMTHEFISMALGTRRSTVTLAMASLQRTGLIRCSRRRIGILNRDGLEAATCECYHAVRMRTGRVLADPAVPVSGVLTPAPSTNSWIGQDTLPEGSAS